MNLLLSLCAVLVLTGCDAALHQHLHVLQRDPLWSCPIPTASLVDHLDSLGTTHGIGFGGTAPDLVDRTYDLHGADPAAVVPSLAACAGQDGWDMHEVGRIGGVPGYYGGKTFPGGWQAVVYINYGHLPTRAERVLSVDIES